MLVEGRECNLKSAIGGILGRTADIVVGDGANEQERIHEIKSEAGLHEEALNRPSDPVRRGIQHADGIEPVETPQNFGDATAPAPPYRSYATCRLCLHIFSCERVHVPEACVDAADEVGHSAHRIRHESASRKASLSADR
ncbi:hypothetical protein PUNSTDRAFT_54484 [Punctularia strigosozonata HHB-11173 SS5]|uniref:uncharacterized protein n=1 Tax=Punctularia strigosozonata (strain HHB-11173) TaxID=741275 RepID=UPI0004416C97|nr:uncharacterized protein PUNSTDRAFT_54484 [Punctularia strigosozonata HHB-11173 SS5]EIN06220.1 hypothetical protein PUNSTDRAFT_54484 [Punctularia strigosozonata HHB-11173 SS5]